MLPTHKKWRLRQGFHPPPRVDQSRGLLQQSRIKSSVTPARRKNFLPPLRLNRLKRSEDLREMVALLGGIDRALRFGHPVLKLCRRA